MDSLRTEHNGQDASLELVIDTDAGSSTTSIKLTLAEDGLHIAHPSPPARTWSQVILCQAARPSTRRFEYLHVVNAAIYTTNSKVVVEIYIVDFNARAAPDGLTKIKGLVQNGYSHTADVWVKHLLDRAYGGRGRQKRLRVAINPASGPGHARSQWTKLVEPIFRAAGCSMDTTFTERKGHCTEIARDLDIGKYDALVLQSGDGLVYEAVNGFCSRLDALVALQNCPLGIIPAGSGNSASCSINGPDMGNNVLMSALTVIKGLPLPADICSITQGERRSFSILSQAYGLMADVDLGTEHLRWMGSQRFVVGFVQRALAGPRYECEISMRIVAADKHAMKAEVVAKASAAQKEIATEPQKPRDPQHIAAKRIESAAGGIPPLRFGTINDSLPAAPDTIRIPGSRASGWTTVHAPLANMYAGQLPWLSRDLLQFPIANSDGTIVMSILPVVSTVTLLTAMNGAEKGKLYEHPQMEYYKLEAFRITPGKQSSRFPQYISIDGESVPFEPFQAEVHAGIGRLLSLRTCWFLPEEWLNS